jgi:hypothetical protein
MNLVDKIARALYQDDTDELVMRGDLAWDELPVWKQASYRVQAKKIIRILKRVKKGEGNDAGKENGCGERGDGFNGH